MSAPSAAPTFFWHDYETFGAQPRREIVSHCVV
jgi:exonuclease I